VSEKIKAQPQSKDGGTYTQTENPPLYSYTQGHTCTWPTKQGIA